MRTELTISELDSQQVELLPARETLWFNNNWAHIYASNSSMALNAGAFYSEAESEAVQNIWVSQG